MLLQLWFIFSSTDGTESSSGFGWSQVFAFGVVIIIMAIMPKIIRKVRRERKALTNQEIKSYENRPNIRNQADSILVELAEMSREINAQSDTKIRVLNKLVRDAEKAIAKYEGLLEREEKLVGRVSNVTPSLGEEVETRVTSDTAQINIESEFRETEKISKADITKDSNSEQSELKRKKDPNTESGVWQDTVGAKITKLHKMGCDINEIARKTRLSTSEVSLMLNLLNLK